jgi:hypothetical protein
MRSGSSPASARRPPIAPHTLRVGDDPAAQFDKRNRITRGVARPGVLDKIVDGGPGPMPGRVLAGINLLDTATHTWDIATATGQPTQLPD